jgi:hypothetical protein
MYRLPKQNAIVEEVYFKKIRANKGALSLVVADDSRLQLMEFKKKKHVCCTI